MVLIDRIDDQMIVSWSGEQSVLDYTFLTLQHHLVEFGLFHVFLRASVPWMKRHRVAERRVQHERGRGYGQRVPVHCGEPRAAAGDGGGGELAVVAAVLVVPSSGPCEDGRQTGQHPEELSSKALVVPRVQKRVVARGRHGDHVTEEEGEIEVSVSRRQAGVQIRRSF